MHYCVASGRVHCVCMYMLTTSAPSRQLLAAGVLDPDDKKPQEEFQEIVHMAGMPRLPDGYTFTEWLRFASSVMPMCICVVPACACMVYIRLLHSPQCSTVVMCTYNPPQEVHPPRPPNSRRRRRPCRVRHCAPGVGLIVCSITFAHDITYAHHHGICT